MLSTPKYVFSNSVLDSCNLRGVDCYVMAKRVLKIGYNKKRLLEAVNGKKLQFGKSRSKKDIKILCEVKLHQVYDCFKANWLHHYFLLSIFCLLACFTRGGSLLNGNSFLMPAGGCKSAKQRYQDQQ